MQSSKAKKKSEDRARDIEWITVRLVPASRWPEIADYVPEEHRSDRLVVPAEAWYPSCDSHPGDRSACLAAFWIPCEQPGRSMDRHTWRPHEDGCDVCAEFIAAQPHEFGSWPEEDWNNLPSLEFGSWFGPVAPNPKELLNRG
jgi:hypothetical protein